MTLDEFRQGKEKVTEREKELADFLLSAEEMYTGQQHVRLMRGIEAIGRDKVDLHILSAGYGFLPADQKIAPYEATFQGMRKKELREWADQLEVPEAFRRILSKSFDLTLVLLGDDYLQACAIDDELAFPSPTLLFCGKGAAKRISPRENLRIITFSNPDAKRFGCPLISLKGEIANRILSSVQKDGTILQKLFDESEKDPAAHLLSTEINSIFTQVNGKENDKKGTTLPAKEVIRFKSFTPRKNAKMHYFIPEWDDRVDPDYDFSCDGITPDRDPYSHDVYSHEIYPSPNYDGILVSKSVIEDNQKKKERISKIGIHAHVRVPRNFPIMADCGAFNYIDEKEPPYESDEIVEFYENLDFDFGVSIDHLIVPNHMHRTDYFFQDAHGETKSISEEEFNKFKKQGIKVEKSNNRNAELFESEPLLFTKIIEDLSEAKYRWEITLRNSQDFIAIHKEKGATFTPIAGCQGWDVESQVEMFKQQQEMGYNYIALGGLVRSKTSQILALLEDVNKVRKPSTRIHLLGVARPDALVAFLSAGVNSIDSARFLRQAWLSATSNYYTGDGETYAETTRKGRIDPARDEWRYSAVRIPPVHREGGTSLTAKAKKLVSTGYSEEKLLEKGKKALETIHAFDRGEVDLDDALKVILEYDQLMGGDPRNEPHYRRVLENKPWKNCPCAVCSETGIDTVIFRRNNRNRRRGFHNTWWFFQYFSKLTSA
jgi:hypothetical protein